MGRAYVCDKCGEIFEYSKTEEKSNFFVKTVVTTEKYLEPINFRFSWKEDNVAKDFDLCPKCTDEVINFISGKHEVE